jgi:hypothetical protein
MLSGHELNLENGMLQKQQWANNESNVSSEAEEEVEEQKHHRISKKANYVDLEQSSDESSFEIHSSKYNCY